MKRFSMLEVMMLAGLMATLRCGPALASGEPWDGQWIKDTNVAASAAIDVTKIAGTAATTGDVATATTLLKPQVDTNATTTATLKTPRYVGDILVGSAGSGTGAVWVATATTTNGWLAIKP